MTAALDPPPSSPTPRTGWRGWFGVERGDVLGGFSAGLVLLAINGAYGIVALAPLGPAYATLGFVLGVHAAVLTAVVTTFSGARGPLLGGPAAALSLLVQPVLIGLLADPQLRLADGRPDVATMLALVAAATVLAGLVQAALALLHLGRVARYVPYPVQAGYLGSVAILMTLAMVPHTLGLPAGKGSLDLADARPLSLLVAVVALLVAWHPPAWTRRVPASVLALLVATGVHYGLQWAFGPARLGPTLGALPVGWPQPDVMAPLLETDKLRLLWTHAPLLLGFVAAVVITSSLQTLLAGNVVDGHTGVRRDGEHTLRAYGWANALGGAFGMPPVAAAVSVSLVGMNAGSTSSGVRPMYALGLVVLLTFSSGLLAQVPMAAIAGVLVAVAASLVDAWSRHSTFSLLQALLRGRRPPGALLAPYAVMGLVVATALGVSLLAGVAVGVIAAVLMFVRSNLRGPVRSVATLAQRRSCQVRPAVHASLLDMHGQRATLIELDGALFFGTADAVAREIGRHASSSDVVVLDFRRVGEIDASGARELLLSARQLHAAGKRLLLAGLGETDPRRLTIDEMARADHHVRLEFQPDVDRALEAAEDHVLAGLGAASTPTTRLGLGQTLIGEGLDAVARSVLAEHLVERRISRGDIVFRQGDPGDALYIVLSGRIGIWLPAPAPAAGEMGRRLVSYAPGVPFGEIGLLRGGSRTASAVAEEDSVLLELSREAFDRLAVGHPPLHAHLLLCLSRHLSARLGTVTHELQAALRT